MAKKSEGDRWLEGRDRHVRVYLTEDEHALVRKAAAQTDRSVSRFSVEAIMEAARQALASTSAPKATDPPAKPAPKKPRKRGAE